MAAMGKNASGGQPRQTIQLQGQSKITSLKPPLFTFRYVNQYNGHESWSVVTQQCAIKLDRPRTINNTPFSFVGFDGKLILLRSPRSTSCLLETSAFVDTSHPPSWSFALKNLLLRTAFPYLTVYGQYDNSAIASGALSLRFAVEKLVPFLPDPYASNITNKPTVSLAMTLTWQPSQKLAIKDMSLTVEGASTSRESPPEGVPTLLDLSTKVSQFGVSFSLEEPPAVKDLYLSGPAKEIGVMTLPAVQ